MSSLNALGYLVGAGSMSLGVEQAGFTLRTIIETPGYGKNAATWDLNRPELAHSILELDHNDEYFRQWAPYDLDLLYGNPPCGGMSAQTCSRIESPTNNCMRMWIRMVTKARPKLILMENGYQLATDRMAPLLGDLTGVLEDAGYLWNTWQFYGYQVGTPQVRRRMFLFGIREDIEVKNLQLAKSLGDLTSKDRKNVCPTRPHLEDFFGVAPSQEPVVTRSGKTVTQHWYDSPMTLRGNELLLQHHEFITANRRWFTLKEYEAAINKAEAGNKLALREIETIPVWPDCPSEFGGHLFRRPRPIPLDEAGPTVIGDFFLFSPVDLRFLTMRELARLMGYPDEWQFHRCNVKLVAQGIPTHSSRWAAERLRKIVGWN
jgi:site-specific DNA-cytosine methylase